jgi:hypothetical protein
VVLEVERSLSLLQDNYNTWGAREAKREEKEIMITQKRRGRREDAEKRKKNPSS